MLKDNLTLPGRTVLVTGAAGFIGSNLAGRLLEMGAKVIGIDSMTDYYDVNIKRERLRRLEGYEDFVFVEDSIARKEAVTRIFTEHAPSVVVNLAAQAGVRYSIENPDAYIESNIIGFYNILEACRHYGVDHLVYASSSSVYGPAGRPDMAYFGFTDKLRAGKSIKIFNYGHCKRDFTYIDDIVEGVIRVMRHAPERRNGADGLPVPPYKVYNIGNNRPENLLDFVTILQEELFRAGVLPEDYDFEAHKELVPMQPGDVPVTYADTAPLEEDFGFKPDTPLRDGLRRFAEWYREYYLL